MFDILNLIQVASLHLEEFVDRDAGTDGSYDDSKKENRTTRYGKFLPSHHHEQFWLMHIPCIKTASQNRWQSMPTTIQSVWPYSQRDVG